MYVGLRDSSRLPVEAQWPQYFSAVTLERKAIHPLPVRFE